MVAPNAAKARAAEPFVIDDVYQALLALGPYSLPCLTDRLRDTSWMPDPRGEPLLGVRRKKSRPFAAALCILHNIRYRT
jgi:hypothetical protein